MHLRARILFVLAAFLVFAPSGMVAAQQPGTGTRSPIVLAEGLFGFDFFMVAPDLQMSGSMAFTTTVNPFSDNVTRAQQLLAQIEEIRAMTGAAKVNLFGHSQGGLDARVILAMRPGVLASLSQFGSPNNGSPVADFLLALSPPGNNFVIDFIGFLIGVVSGNIPTADTFRVALNQLSTPGMAAFNTMFPAGLPAQECGSGAPSVSGVPLFSFAGNMPATNGGDISDFVLGLASFLFAGVPNDGLVAVCSAAFGTVVRADLGMNHIDLVNQLNGLVGADNPLALFRAHASRLAEMGL